MTQSIPAGFSCWRECRDYYALEALFLLQVYERSRTRANRKRYEEAARKAFDANDHCTGERRTR